MTLYLNLGSRGPYFSAFGIKSFLYCFTLRTILFPGNLWVCKRLRSLLALWELILRSFLYLIGIIEGLILVFWRAVMVCLILRISFESHYLSYSIMKWSREIMPFNCFFMRYYGVLWPKGMVLSEIYSSFLLNKGVSM